MRFYNIVGFSICLIPSSTISGLGSFDEGSYCPANCCLRNPADAGQIQMDLSKISGNTLLVCQIEKSDLSHRENDRTLGMVPLIINPIYTLYILI